MNWKFICILLMFNFSLHSFAQSNGDTTKNKTVGHPQRTLNPNTPFIYKKGFGKYTILTKKILLKDRSTKELNELKFDAVYSCFYTKKMMYENFGKWTKEIRPNIDDSHPILVWEKIKLFKDEDKLYSVYANGEENQDEIYASVLVFNENNQDCLAKTSSEKEKIIMFFSDGIKNLSNSNKFHRLYSRWVNNYKPKKSKS
ncbi:hypothetical protein GSF70_15060 [Flavobacteriaceae bacterium W22]|nr:hypothetical protein [Flavobacteriaceae bacterium W22]